MKYVIEYSGGPPDRVWHGQVIVEAEDAAQAIHKVENDMACIPASIDSVNPHDEVNLPLKDRRGSNMGVGDRFKYQVGSKHECIGVIAVSTDGPIIKWEGTDKFILVSEFWHAASDERITEKI